MTYLFRTLKASDFEKVQAFLDVFCTETVFTNQYPGQPPKDKEKVVKAYENPDSFFMGVFDETERMVGSVSATILRPGHPWSGFVCRFGISLLKEVYGKGLASRLMDEMIAWAKSKGMHRIEGEVRAQNQRAIGLYLHKGFQIEGMKRENAQIDGVWHNSYMIGKILD